MSAQISRKITPLPPQEQASTVKNLGFLEKSGPWTRFFRVPQPDFSKKLCFWNTMEYQFWTHIREAGGTLVPHTNFQCANLCSASKRLWTLWNLGPGTRFFRVPRPDFSYLHFWNTKEYQLWTHIREPGGTLVPHTKFQCANLCSASFRDAWTFRWTATRGCYGNRVSGPDFHKIGSRDPICTNRAPGPDFWNVRKCTSLPHTHNKSQR